LSPPAQVAVRSRPRDWVNNAIRLIEADAHRSADTHLLRYPLPSAWSDNAGIELYLKDETTHITGSLKHRLARSLFLWSRYSFKCATGVIRSRFGSWSGRARVEPARQSAATSAIGDM
jgi:hypothetical protein